MLIVCLFCENILETPCQVLFMIPMRYFILSLP